MLQERGYVYGTHWAPHDIEARELGTGKSRLEVAKGLGLNFRVAPRLTVGDGIEAVRNLLPRCWFDAERCRQGLRALKSYHRDFNKRRQSFLPHPVHDWSSHCFTGETEVLTRYGTCQIMHLPPSGEVLTPCGWKEYRNPRLTRRNAPLAVVKFEDGLTVRCTPEHLFRTEDGWRSAESLKTGTLIQSSLTLSRNTSMAASIVFGPVINIIREVGRSCIEMHGQSPLGRFQRDAISTTKMAIQRTIFSLISNAFQAPNTSPSRGTMVRLLSEPNISLNTPGNRLPSGTNPKLDAFGIAGMRYVPKGGLNGNGSLRIAPCAKRNFFVWLGRAELLRNIAAKNAKCLRIESVEPKSDSADVWCLTVPDGECFSLANGAVVHNCADAFRTGAVTSKDKGASERAPHRPRGRRRSSFMSQ